jgi:hypothetical protein
MTVAYAPSDRTVHLDLPAGQTVASPHGMGGRRDGK